MCDVHVHIVGDNREVVRRVAIRSQDDKVLDMRIIEGDGSVYEIREYRRPIRNLEANRSRRAETLSIGDRVGG